MSVLGLGMLSSRGKFVNPQRETLFGLEFIWKLDQRSDIKWYKQEKNVQNLDKIGDEGK